MKPTLTFIIFFFVFPCYSYSQQPDNWIRLDSAERSYLFQVTEKKIRPEFETYYYSFKSGYIHKTQAGYFGKLLHGEFKILGKEQRLMEQGRFRMGEKSGVWYTWFENGAVRTKTRYRSRGDAAFIEEYDQKGMRIKKGYSKKNLFTGRQTEYIKDSAIIIHYKKGVRQEKSKN